MVPRKTTAHGLLSVRAPGLSLPLTSQNGTSSNAGKRFRKTHILVLNGKNQVGLRTGDFWVTSPGFSPSPRAKPVSEPPLALTTTLGGSQYCYPLFR